MSELCVGLFGTCGNSTWRNNIFIPKYLENKINFFNPQVADWDPSLAEIEAHHLVNDRILCFPVTAETYGIGSLAETGFSILQAIKFDDRRQILLLVDKIPDPVLNVDDSMKSLSKVSYKESCRARALVIQHIKKINLPNVRLVNTLKEMLEWSIFLYNKEIEITDFELKFKNGQ